MKKLISIGASFILAVSIFAAGTLGFNTPQGGSVVFTPAGGLIVTNSFAYPFQTAPLMQLYSSATNVTYTSTTTNFVITSVGAGGATNYSVTWSAFVGGTRMQSGTSSLVAGGATYWTNIFSYPYASAPSVVVSGSLLPSATNNVVVVSSVSATGFVTATGNTNQTVYWISIGTVYNPQTEYQGQNPLSNKIVY